MNMSGKSLPKGRSYSPADLLGTSGKGASSSTISPARLRAFKRLEADRRRREAFAPLPSP